VAVYEARQNGCVVEEMMPNVVPSPRRNRAAGADDRGRHWAGFHIPRTGHAAGGWMGGYRVDGTPVFVIDEDDFRSRCREIATAFGGGEYVRYAAKAFLCTEVARWIRVLQPEVVLGHDPWKRYRLHPDHRNAGLLACDGVVAARDPHFFRDHGLAPHRPAAMLLWEADVPNHVEDVSEHVSEKLAGLEAHESQFESTMHASDASELDAFRTRVTGRLAELGEPHGLAAAEVFALLTDL